MADRDAPNYIFRPPSSMDRERGSLVTVLMSQWFLRATALVVFVIFGLVVWFAYVEGSGGENGESPLVRAPTAPDKVMVDQSEGAAASGKPASIDVVRKAGNTPPGPEKVVTEAEKKPPADPVEGEQLDLSPDSDTASGDPGAATSPAVAPSPSTSTGAVTTPATPSAGAPARSVTGNLAADGGQPMPSKPESAAGRIAPSTTPAPAPMTATPPPTPSSPANVPTTAMVITAPPAMTPPASVTRPQVAVNTPAPADEPTVPTVVATEQSAPAIVKPEPPQRTVMVDPPRPVPPAPKPVVVASGKFRIQLASVRDPRAAAKTWQDLVRRYPKPLAGVDANVVRAEADGVTVFRVQAGPYPSRDAAAARCRTITAAGGACFVVGSGS